VDLRKVERQMKEIEHKVKVGGAEEDQTHQVRDSQGSSNAEMQVDV
jgi:hypothetical protein